MNELNKKTAIILKISAWIVLFTSLFLNYGKYEVYLFPILISASYLISKQYKTMFKTWIFYAIIFAVAYLFGGLVTTIVLLGIGFYVFWQWKKAIDRGELNDVYTTAQRLTAKMQLSAIERIEGRGDYVSKEFKDDLRDVANGKKATTKNT